MNIDVREMNATDRRQLLQLACFGAWSDLEIAPEERRFVLGLAISMAVGEDELDEVRSWLDHAPPEIDPNELPLQHREVFLATLWEVVIADGRVAPEESETLALIREFMGG